jgi:hypothetical protein
VGQSRLYLCLRWLVYIYSIPRAGRAFLCYTERGHKLRVFTLQKAQFVPARSIAQSLMFLDLLFYVILPRWFGLRHLFFIGGDSPEPLNGAIKMGINESIFIAGVLVYSSLMAAGCARYIWQSTRGPQIHAKILNKSNIGKSADELAALWNAEHPNDPVEE